MNKEEEISPDNRVNQNQNMATAASQTDDIHCRLFLFKSLAVPLAAIFSSISLPLSILAIEKKLTPSANLSIEQKLSQTLIPYSVLVCFRFWLLWYRIGARLDGKPDETIETILQAHDDASWIVTAGMIANISAFTNGLLLAFHQLQDSSHTTTFSVGVSLGLLSYTSDLLTDVSDAFRKYTEEQKKLGNHISPIFKQKIIVILLDNHLNNIASHIWQHLPNSTQAQLQSWKKNIIDALKNSDHLLANKTIQLLEKFESQSSLKSIAILLREALPVITGFIRARATAEVMANLLEMKLTESQLKVFNILLGILVFEASAYYAKFDVIQLHDNFEASQLPNFPLDNALVSSKRSLLRFVGKLSSGQLLVDTFQKMKLSINNSVNALYGFATIGFMSLIFTILEAYVTTKNKEPTQENE